MDPIIFEILGSLLVGGMVYFTIFHRPGLSATQPMPMLAIRRTKQISRRPRSVSSRAVKVGSAKQRKRARVKAAEQVAESTQTASQTTNAVTALNACPSCGLQAPEELLAEHFLGSPSHRNGPPKAPTVDTKQVETNVADMEDDSKQSVRNLLQILVPPRAFGRRHAHRSASAIPSVVQELEPRRRYP